MTDEAGIKFNCQWQQKAVLSAADVDGLNHWRQALYEENLIGVLDDGIGFGNISSRIPGSNSFIISGSGTGKFSSLGPQHYSIVRECRIDDNYVRCDGLTKASSETFTHAILYNLDPKINAVVHVHHPELWQRGLAYLPVSSEDAAYGSIELAHEVERMFKETKVKTQGIFVMGGHRDGLVSFGSSLENAAQRMLKELRHQVVKFY